MNDLPKIDWTPFFGSSKNEIECKCGSVFKSHSKGVFHNNLYSHVVETPCPGCGAIAGFIRISSDYENWKI